MNRNELCVLRDQGTTSTGIAIGEQERSLGSVASTIMVIVSQEAHPRLLDGFSEGELLSLGGLLGSCFSDLSDETCPKSSMEGSRVFCTMISKVAAASNLLLSPHGKEY